MNISRTDMSNLRNYAEDCGVHIEFNGDTDAPGWHALCDCIQDVEQAIEIAADRDMDCMVYTV